PGGEDGGEVAAVVRRGMHVAGRVEIGALYRVGDRSLSGAGGENDGCGRDAPDRDPRVAAGDGGGHADDAGALLAERCAGPAVAGVVLRADADRRQQLARVDGGREHAFEELVRGRDALAVPAA